jgi:hypothetical protein
MDYELFDAEGEFDEVMISMIISDNLAGAVNDGEIPKPVQILGERFSDSVPFNNIGQAIIDNGLENGLVVLNNLEVCIINYDNYYYKITCNSDNNHIGSVVYTIYPSNEL